MGIEPNKLPRPTVRVNLAKSVDLAQLNTIIGSIGGRYGCRTCGLLGFDLTLSGDPEEFGEAGSLPGVQSVRVE